MFKKIGALLCAFVVLVGGVFSTSFNSSAYGDSASGNFYVKYSEPYCSDNCGYVSIMYRASNGYYRLYTYFWTITPAGDNAYSTNVSARMDVTITGNIVRLTPIVTSNGGWYYTLACYDMYDNLHILHGGQYYPSSSTVGESYTSDYSGEPVQGYTYGGNCLITASTTYNDVAVPIINWDNSVDATTLDGQLYQVIASLNNIDYDTSSIILNLQYIYNENVEIQQKLDNMTSLLNQIKSEQQESNTWLEKIFEFLEEKDEKDKEVATQQGNNSTSQGMNAIDDKGAGFTSSLGSLTNSMSYNGTECAWNMPQIKLPAISGVMDEVVLLESHPIDFTQWVAAIPSNIMLVIQSVLTSGLIVYCFKELYNTIAYVLTLRKDDNS